MKYCMIVAIDKENGIGKQNSLPWHIPEDLKYFAKLTKGKGNNAVIMGRKTYESIGKPLPNRLNIIITTQKDKYQDSKNCLFTDLDGVGVFLNNNSFEEIWCIGGESIYREFLNKTEELYVTEIDDVFNCDAYFINNFQDKFSKNEILKTSIVEKRKIIYRKYFHITIL